MTELKPPPDSPEPLQTPPQEESPFEPAIRAGKSFLKLFFVSWAIVYLSGPLKLEWLYFVGLTGVGFAMIRLLVWLIR